MSKKSPVTADPVVDAHEISKLFEIETTINVPIEMDNTHCDHIDNGGNHFDYYDHLDSGNPKCPPPA